MRRVGGLIIALALALALGTGLFAPTRTAQGQDYADRKVITRVAPAYPELAKRMHVGGVVKLEIVIRANGRVKSTKVVGGNPVLIESATEAVRQWKFEAAREENTEVVEVTFTAH
jgi:TonB family protein